MKLILLYAYKISGGFLMERIALQKLIEWNNNKRKKPLIVWGARQVGKTYLIQELFAKEYYKNNYLYIDCKKRR